MLVVVVVSEMKMGFQRCLTSLVALDGAVFSQFPLPNHPGLYYEEAFEQTIVYRLYTGSAGDLKD